MCLRTVVRECVKAHKKRKKRKENIQVEIESRFKNNKKIITQDE